MANLLQLMSKLPIDDEILRRVPIPGLSGACILEIDTTRGINETPPSSPMDALANRNTPTLDAVVAGLRAAARDDKVLGLIAHSTGAQLSLSQADELRTAVQDFRESGKPTTVWSESYGEFGTGLGSYLFASAFDEVWLQPSGDVSLLGVGTTGTFLRGALDKLGITAQFYGRKEFKSAAEMFTDTEFSPANREQLQAVLDSLMESFTRAVTAGRDLEPERVTAVLNGPPLTPQQALEGGLIDRIGYRDEAYAAMRARVGDDPEHPATLRYVERYSTKSNGGAKTKGLRGRHRPVIALVHAQGGIHTGRNSSQGPFGSSSIGSETLGAALRHVVKQEVAAVVLRVDSPGGSATASDAIRREVMQVREAGIPVVASMGRVAASGGYYISMPATEIVAGATTITGSIGVLLGKLVTGAAWSRVGVTSDSIESGPFAQMLSGRQEFTSTQLEAIDVMLDRIYDDFVAKAAQDRKMSLDQLEPLARGRIWTGRDAQQHGLVDHLGGLSAAIDRACILVGALRADVDVQVMPKLSPFDRFFPSDNSDAPTASAFSDGPAMLNQLMAAAGLGGQGLLSVGSFPIPR